MRRKRDLGDRGGKGRKGFTPEERSAHLLNFWSRGVGVGWAGAGTGGKVVGGVVWSETWFLFFL